MDKKQVFNHQDSKPLTDPATYRSLVGKIFNLTITRPDLAYFIQTLTQYMSHPLEIHLAAAHRLLRYIKATPGLVLFYPTNNSFKLQAFYDSDWDRCPKQGEVPLAMLFTWDTH